MGITASTDSGQGDKSIIEPASDEMSAVHEFMEHLPDIAWVKDDQFRYRYINAAFAALFDITPSEVFGREDFDFMPKETADKLRENDRQVLKRGEAIKTIEDVAGATGEPRRWSVHKFPLPRTEGPAWVGGKATDITVSLKAEEELKKSEENYRLLVESSPFCIHRIDRDGRLTSMNRAGLEMIGESNPQSIVGVPYVSAVCVGDRSRIADLMQMAFAGSFSEFEFQGTSGQHFRSNSVPMRAENGQIESLLGITEEISDRVQAESKLRASEERYRLVAMAARDPIWEIDITTGEVSWNELYDKMFGVRPEETGQSWDWWTSRIREDERDRVEASLKAVLANPAADNWSMDYHFLSANRESLFVQDRAFISRDAKGNPLRIIGTMRDQTPIERAMKEREELIQDVQEAQRLESLGVLAGGIAHDFNNLLTSILTNVSYVGQEMDPESDQSKVLREAEDAVKRAADLCQQMLAYAGKGRFVLKELNLSSEVSHIVDLLHVSTGKNVRLKLQLAPDLPPIKADQAQISQVVMNLVINASEAIGDAVGEIRVATGQTLIDSETPDTERGSPLLDNGTYVFLEVSDNGLGMDQDTLARIFEPFFSTKFTGRGLGLAAVQGIMRGHKGSLSVKSEIGVGTQFRALLPTSHDEVSATTNASPKSQSSPPHPSLGAKTILFIDDEPGIRRSAGRLLKKLGYNVRLASDGYEGLESFRAAPNGIDLVILDLTMPRMDGIATFKELRKDHQDIPVILMSGHSQFDSLERFHGMKISSFLQKPFTAQSLASAIERTLSH